ncbi:MAG: DNA mismatch repair protein MutS [Anaerobutyricum sp.]|nr:DNA mismatch repair protein MutS [Eubacterium sp.]MDY6046071.1 DNA mismatch repair protein MutS [Anaerobutyricum sp.]
MAKLTPMMEQYFEIKNKYKDCILFYRLGDFYEMFYDDALVASKELEITLTGKNCGQEERAPMCGVPFHSCEPYISKLVERGYRVAICEQVEDPKAAKGIVKRDVIRVVTPGTNTMSQSLDESRNNYIMSVFCENDSFGVAVCDLSTGEFRTTQVEHQDALFDEMNKFEPSEIICNDAFCICGMDFDFIREKIGAVITPVESYFFEMDHCEKMIREQYHLINLEGIGLADYPFGVIASGGLLQYLHETQKTSLSHLMELIPYSTQNYMVLDSSTRRNLELCETLREKSKKGSLLWVLDKTKTAMGARMLRKMVEQPLIHKKSIMDRLDAVEMLKENVMAREELREYMNSIYDLERLTMKISYRSANPRDLISFKTSIQYLPYIKAILEQFSKGLLAKMAEDLNPLEDLYELLDQSIEEDPPIPIKEGGIIKDGFSEEVDHLKKAKTEGKSWLAELEEREREKTGIKNLRVRFNKVFGYYIEVTNSYKDLVPDYYIRRQTLANAERYITEELEELARTILGAEDKLCALEYELYVDIREKLAAQMDRIQKTAHVIAWVDAFASLALTAEQNGYVRPTINQKGTIDIKEGRHPVVEKMMRGDLFVSNDTLLDHKKNRVNIITGPNMAGKSTYMRQTALIVLMAQIGSFVPAKSASIGLVDRIFTRVGASDDLASGQSTFMVEMSEVANILRNATKDSLLILDEIGRGTSTFDGLSIAWAVVEYISGSALSGAKTLFATHYHELTELEGKLPGVNNYCIAVQEKGDNIIFLRKIIKGSADKSYGIQVAKLAGVPDPVIERAKEIAQELEQSDITSNTKNLRRKKETEEEPVQLSLFDTMGIMPVEMKESPVEAELKQADLGNMTPIQALNYLYELQKKCH